MDSTSPGKTILLAFDWHDERIFQGIASYCKEHNWHLSPYFFSCRHVPKNWPGDGAITCFGPELSDVIMSMDMPAVDITVSDIPRPIPRVRVNNKGIAEKAADYFMDKGFMDFAYFSWERVEINQIRKNYFVEALSERGVPDSAVHTIEQPGDEILMNWELHLDMLVKQLEKLPRPLAVFTGQDNIAVTLIEACRIAGILVPDEVSVLGVDNIEFMCECSSVPLSSVDARLFDLGYDAADQLGRLMRGEIDENEPVRHVAIGEVIERQSSDLIAVKHPKVAQALAMMRQGLTSGVTIPEIYEKVGMSQRGLEKAFKAHLGKSPAAVLRQLRLAHAKRMLAQTDIKIEAIAYDCGYSNGSNLNHAFSREVGMTPQQYRAKFGSKLPIRF